MRFNPKALVVFVAGFLFLALALSSSGSEWKGAGEAIASVLIVLSLVGFLGDGRRTR
jgi:hypothetical protein